MKKPMPEGVKKLIIHNVNEVEEVASTVDFVFSAVDMIAAIRRKDIRGGGRGSLENEKTDAGRCEKADYT